MQNGNRYQSGAENGERNGFECEFGVQEKGGPNVVGDQFGVEEKMR